MSVKIELNPYDEYNICSIIIKGMIEEGLITEEEYQIADRELKKTYKLPI